MTGVVGVLCLVYGRIPEGLIIIGAVVIISITALLMSKKNLKPSQSAMEKAAGNVIVTLEGACRVNGRKGENCVMNLCQNGVFFDMEESSIGLINYSDIDLQDSGSVHHIQFNIKGIGVCRFVCNNKIKVKAITQAFAKIRTDQSNSK